MSQRDVGAADPVVEATGELVKLVDEVVESHAPIVVARDGEPKAALVSMEDYARLKQDVQANGAVKKLSWQEWSKAARQLQEDILAYRGGKPIDIEWLIEVMHRDHEDRDAINSGL